MIAICVARFPQNVVSTQIIHLSKIVGARLAHQPGRKEYFFVRHVCNISKIAPPLQKTLYWKFVKNDGERDHSTPLPFVCYSILARSTNPFPQNFSHVSENLHDFSWQMRVHCLRPNEWRQESDHVCRKVCDSHAEIEKWEPNLWSQGSLDMGSAILVNGAPDLGSFIKFRSSLRMFATDWGLNEFI